VPTIDKGSRDPPVHEGLSLWLSTLGVPSIEQPFMAGRGLYEAYTVSFDMSVGRKTGDAS
jgi:hypothetical protein